MVTKYLFNSNLAIATFSNACPDSARLALFSALRWRLARWWAHAGMRATSDTVAVFQTLAPARLGYQKERNSNGLS